MKKTIPATHKSLALLAAVLLLGCADEGPVMPDQTNVSPTQLTTVSALNTERAITALRRATARYHNLNSAIDDGFVLLHPCENRPNEGPVGAVYVRLDRLDAVIDPERPEALIYEPPKNGGRFKLVGAEFAIPYALWTDDRPPAFLGHTFQREDEFGVFALHVWIWRTNPEGMFAESNPNVSCGVGESRDDS